MNKKKCKKIGIVGGMGPESTSLFYTEIIKSFQLGFGAYKDEDFPEMFIHNLPIPDIVTNITNEDLIRNMLSRSIHILEQFGAELIAFPCNSLDYFIDDLVSQATVPVISIIQATCQVIKERNLKNVLLLSTPTTFNKGLYHKYLNGISIIRPHNYHKVNKVIISTLKGENPKNEFLNMLKTDYSSYENIVIACTDLSILVNEYHDQRLIDSTKCIAASIFKASYNNQ